MGQQAKARGLLARIAFEHEELGRAKVEAGDVETTLPFGRLPQPDELVSPRVVSDQARQDGPDVAQPCFTAIACPAIELEVEAHVGMQLSPTLMDSAHGFSLAITFCPASE